MELLLGSGHLILLQTVFIVAAAADRTPDEGLEPIFDTRTINQTVIAGDTVSLNCTVTSIGMYVVAWMNPRMTVLTRGDIRISENMRISVERPFVSDWNLHIRDVRYEDRGEYTCFINTEPPEKKKVYLDVKVPPQIISTKPAQRTEVREGDTARLFCNATGVPSPTITWIKHRRNIYGEAIGMNSSEAIGTSGEYLIIYSISRNCEGTYECRAANGIREAKSAQIEVDVVFPPKVTVTNKRLGQYRGKDTILECTISASPFGISGWERNGKEIKRSEKYRTDIYRVSEEEQHVHTLQLVLYIFNLHSEDYGQYSCFAFNIYGTDRDSTLLYESIISTSSRITSTAKQITTTDGFMWRVAFLYVTTQFLIIFGTSEFINSSERTSCEKLLLLTCLIHTIIVLYLVK